MQIKKVKELPKRADRGRRYVVPTMSALRKPQAFLRIAGRRIQLFVKANAQAMITSSTEKLRNAFVKALGVSPDSDFESMAYGQTPGWDSIAHMALISEIETAFDIMLATDDVIGMSNFLKAKEIVARNGVSFA